MKFLVSFFMVILCLSLSCLFAQTITTGTLITTSLCDGGPVDISFTVTGNFYYSNYFIAQLSDETGDFTSPTSIGTLTGTSGGTINATIPYSLFYGTGFRIRVVSTNPYIEGSDNGADISIGNDINMDLVAYYPLNGNANDASGFMNNGIAIGVTYDNDNGGIANNACKLNGNSYIKIKYSSYFDVMPEGQFTISCMIKPDFSVPHGTQAIFVKSPLNSRWNYGLYLINNKLMVGNDVWNDCLFSDSLKSGKWYCVSLTYNNGRWKLYLDRKKILDTVAAKITQSTGGLAIGRKGEASTPDDYYYGDIDEVMFNSRALTECEIESFCAVKIDTIINCKQNGPELIVNGDFKKGNTDFTTDYTYNSTSGMNEGVYTVRNDIPPWHYQFSDCKDHTTGSTNMMIVNGYSYTSNKRVWEQNIKLEKGKNYEFSIWCLHVCYANLSKAKLRFFINKIPIGPDFQLKVTNCAWQNYRTTFYSNSDSNSVLTIIDANLEGSGNDFAIDDISLHECISANPPEITYNDDCYKLTGIAKVSDSDTTNFSNIAITSDVNVKFNVENYTGKKQIGFTAELLDYRQDGKFNIDVTDSFLITTSKLIEIPGFTVGIKGNELKEPIIAIDSAINSTKKILFPFTIVNYGKFDQNITGFLFNNSCFTTDITAPVNLKPGDTLKFNVVYLSSTPTFINDTLKIQNKCGTRPIVQLNINYSGCGGNSFVFSDFLNVNNLNLIGAASKCDSVIRLTQQVRNQVGAMWYSNKVQINKSFTTSFKFRISKGDNSTSNENSLPGADGITFVVQDYSNTAKGGSGGEIGYGGIPKSLAVEFDLFANDANQIEDFKDPNGNHLAVQSNGINPNTARHNDTTTLGINNNLLTIKSDSTIYIVKIDYNIKPGSMRIFIGTDENILKLSLVIDSLDIPKLLVLDDYKNAYIGITSATGDAYEIHDILYWDFCSEFITDIEDNSMKELKTNIDLNIYPNPNNGIFNLSLKNADISDVIISDVLGNIIYRDRTNTENKSINLSFQPKGVYFVKVVSGKNIDIIKIIVD